MLWRFSSCTRRRGGRRWGAPGQTSSTRDCLHHRPTRSSLFAAVPRKYEDHGDRDQADDPDGMIHLTSATRFTAGLTSRVVRTFGTGPGVSRECSGSARRVLRGVAAGIVLSLGALAAFRSSDALPQAGPGGNDSAATSGRRVLSPIRSTTRTTLGIGRQSVSAPSSCTGEEGMPRIAPSLCFGLVGMGSSRRRSRSSSRSSLTMGAGRRQRLALRAARLPGERAAVERASDRELRCRHAGSKPAW